MLKFLTVKEHHDLETLKSVGSSRTCEEAIK